MSQSNYNIPNVSAPAVRTQLNAVFSSIATNNSGATEPTTTFAHQWWYDTSTSILKIRNEANSTWISVAYFDQGAGAFRLLDDTQVVNTSGVQVGLLGDQSTAAWEAGVSTLPSLVSPEQVRAAISTNAVLAATASASLGAIGTYAMLWDKISRNHMPGDTVAGSDFNFSNANGTVFGTSPAGTWRLMGSQSTGSGSPRVSLWLRIS